MSTDANATYSKTFQSPLNVEASKQFGLDLNADIMYFQGPDSIRKVSVISYSWFGILTSTALQEDSLKDAGLASVLQRGEKVI